MTASSSLIPAERIERAILLIRGEKVMLDADLAALYGVQTKQLVQAVKRNTERFPPDFMYQLTAKELADWRSQIVTSNPAAKNVASPATLCLHRKRRGDAFQCASQQAGGGREHRDHANIHAPAATAF